MDSFLKLDIFFIITSVAVVILTVLIMMISFRIIKILKNIEYITNTLRNTVHSAESGILDIGERITESPLFAFIFGKKKSTPRREKSSSHKI